MPKIKEVFWHDDPNAGHFYLILTPPSQPELVLVNFTSYEDWKDTTVVVEAAEAGFLTKKSVIAFERARLVPTDAVLRTVDQGHFAFRGVVSDELWLRIIDGATISQRTPVEVIEFLDHLGIR